MVSQKMLTQKMLTQKQTGTELRVAVAPRFVSVDLSSEKARSWAVAIALVVAVVCALSLLLATLGAVAAGAGKPESSRTQSSTGSGTQTYEGMVTDTRCGARHSSAIGRTATDCTLICVRAGGQFVLIDGDASYVLEGGLAALKQVAGQRARIIGTLNGKTISVEAVMTLNAGS
jgi:hypothetical protein